MARKKRRKQDQKSAPPETQSSEESSSAEKSADNQDTKTSMTNILTRTPMSRMASLFVLIVIIVVISVLFYRVMATFILPLFLAALFAVLFRPIHRWMLVRFKDRETVAAGLTTTAILCIVLLPLLGVLTLAAHEAWTQQQNFDYDLLREKVGSLGETVGFTRPFKTHIEQLDLAVAEIPDKLPSTNEIEPADLAVIQDAVSECELLWEDIEKEFYNIDGTPDRDYAESVRFIQNYNKNPDSDESNLTANMKSVIWMFTAGALTVPDDEPHDEADQNENAHRDQASLENEETPVGPDENEGSHTDENEVAPTLHFEPLFKMRETLALADKYFHGDDLAEDDAQAEQELTKLASSFPRLPALYLNVRQSIHGGFIGMRGSDVFLPFDYQFESGRDMVEGIFFKQWLSITGQATSIATQLLIGLAIMVLGMFYFLKDGPGMIRDFMRLSPLDDKYEQELLSEFDSVSRAVVLATLLSAFAQGLLAGLGYWVAGFESVFLLTMLTMVIAMVPVVGAAAVWVPASLWLVVVEGRPVAGTVLAIYGATVVSMIDNLIKPFVLHGQSNLHPLLALLSVLGGVQALGPIGIIVGPMVVSFLQALLNMLHIELQEIDRSGDEAAKDTS